MDSSAHKLATYEDLAGLPDHVIGEIIAGELISSPRPSPKHSYASSSLGGELHGPYKKGQGGPGGWIILDEPEVQLSEHILVPDLAGWKAERLPNLPKTNFFSTPPDWVCEILSPSTARLDRVKKMPIYLEHEVSHIWLIDPEHKILEAFRREGQRWILIGTFGENQKVKIEPFAEMELALEGLWSE